MLNIGVTGGIGSGKTTVCRLFEALGIPVYDADTRAKALMTTNESLKRELVRAFGAAVYFADGLLNRAYLAELVFKNNENLQVLNRLVHPLVAQDALDWHTTQQNTPYTLREAALLIESGSYRQLDYLILVTAPLALRLERVMQRDNTTANEVQARMAKQLSDDEKRPFAQFFIENNGVLDLQAQVLSVHNALCALAAAKT